MSYSESELVEQPAIRLFAELDWETLSAADEVVIATLRKQLDDAACKRVLKDTVTATGWVYETIKRICGGRG